MGLSIDESIAEEAREWVGTPFIWDQSQKGRGCDCKGLLAGVMRELGRPEAESFYAACRGYRADRPVPSDLLLEGMQTLFDRVDEPAAGHFLLLKHGQRPGHLAIMSSPTMAVHAFPGRREQVCERSLEVLFHKFPLHSAWRARPCQ